MDNVGTITDNNLTALTLASNVALGQAATPLTSNGLQDGATAGVTITGGSDNAHVTLNLTGGAAAGKTDTVTLGNGNDIVADASTAGTVTVTVGTGANLVELGSASSDLTGLYTVTLSARTSTAINAVVVGTAGTNYASAPNMVITGITTGDVIVFANDAFSSSNSLTATSLSTATSVANAVSILEWRPAHRTRSPMASMAATPIWWKPRPACSAPAIPRWSASAGRRR